MSYRGGGAEPPRLEPRNLFTKRVQRDTARLRAYNQLLNQIHLRIQATSQLSGNANYLMYTVPPFILGLPAIDLQDCIVYLVHMLRGEGFEVRFTYPNLLYISWKHYEKQYIAEDSPIIQAMKPLNLPGNTSKKGAGGKRGTASTASTASTAHTVTFNLAGAGAAPHRSASDYQPPDSFMATMQRPPPKEITGKGAAAVLEELWKF